MNACSPGCIGTCSGRSRRGSGIVRSSRRRAHTKTTRARKRKREEKLHAGRGAVLNERASPPKGRGREAEHPPEGAVEVGSVSKAGGVGGLGGRGTPCHLA